MLSYVEQKVGWLVSWLHAKDEYFGALMDELYGPGDGPERPSGDDDMSGYNSFPTDDWSGPQAQSGKTAKGHKHGPMDDDVDDDADLSANPAAGGPSVGSGPGGKFGDSASGVMRSKGQAAVIAAASGSHSRSSSNGGSKSSGLGGVTKLAADVYALPSLRQGQAYAAVAPTTTTAGGGAVGGAAASFAGPSVVRAAALSESYYDALSGLARTSAHYAAHAAAAATAGAPTDRATLAFTATGAGGRAAAGSAQEVTLHPVLTAAATVSAFVAGLVATKAIG